METAAEQESSNHQLTSTQFDKTTALFDYDKAARWRVTSLIFSFVATAVISYITISLLCYGFRKKLILGCKGKTGKSDEIYQFSAAENAITLISCLSSLVYIAVEIPLIVPQIEPFCFFYHKVEVCSYALALFLDYFLLWYRIYIALYSQPFSKSFVGCLPRFLCYFCVVSIFGIGAGNFVLFITSPASIAYPRIGCIVNHATTEHKLASFITLGMGTGLSQALLLFIFIYPLCSHRRKIIGAVAISNMESILPVIKRATITATVCVASDFLTVTLSLIYQPATMFIYHILYGSNLFINLVSIILSSADWKEKVMPFRQIHTPQHTRRDPKSNGALERDTTLAL